MTALLREAVGDALRQARTQQGRTLREVSDTARVSLGYLSEVERGRKEASSELLNAICGALGMPLSAVLFDAGERSLHAERAGRLVDAERALHAGRPTVGTIDADIRVVIPPVATLAGV